MLAAFAQGGKDVEGVSVGEAAEPAGAAGEAVVRLTAATLDYRDLLAMRGLAPSAVEPE